MKRKPITKSRRMRLIQMHGDSCINCGSPDEIEWHHVVPLEIGGADTDTNLVPLCRSCHTAVTHHELLLKTSGRPRHSGGRQRTIPENYKEILHDYLLCRISKTECVKRLGLSPKNKINDSAWFKEYLEEQGIESYRNNVELKALYGILVPGICVGYIKYIDGHKEEILYNPDGSDDRVSELLEKSKAMKVNKTSKPRKIIREIDDEINKDSTSNADREMWREYRRKIVALYG